MVDKKKILLVGIGGYGETYVNEILKAKREDYCVAGIVETNPKGCRQIKKLSEMNIPIYPSPEKFYENDSADLAILSTPIQFHREQTIYAVSHGSNVLCEKPAAGSVAAALEMEKEAVKSNKFVLIGYQWSFSKAIRSLKKDILDGIYGRALKLKSIVLWPRNKDYYARRWAGKVKAANGEMILDSVAHNATAHYLHNMLYILGDKIDACINPEEIDAEVYRVNDIENFDTAVINVKTSANAKLTHIATHTTLKQLNPCFEYEFENGSVYYDGNQSAPCVTGKLKDGAIIEYGNPNGDEGNKFNHAVDMLWDASLNPVCGIQAAMGELKVIEYIYEHAEIQSFPPEKIKITDDGSLKYVEGLYETLMDKYKNFR